nr:modelin-1, mod-1=antiviral amphiphilic peptide [synthetic, Peptide Synthetic, 17 aa] [synthetic construct]
KLWKKWAKKWLKLWKAW